MLASGSEVSDPYGNDEQTSSGRVALLWRSRNEVIRVKSRFSLSSVLPDLRNLRETFFRGRAAPVGCSPCRTESPVGAALPSALAFCRNLLPFYAVILTFFYNFAPDYEFPSHFLSGKACHGAREQRRYI